MGFYDDLANVASSLLAARGQQVTFTRDTTVAFDPIEGKNVTTETTFTANGVIFERGIQLERGKRHKLLIDVPTTEPIESDKVTVNGVDHYVDEVIKVAPAGTPVYYVLMLTV